MLVPSGKRDDDDLEELRSRVADREAVLDERSAEVAQAKAALERFRIDYRRRVGILHEKLDALEAAIAEAEADVRQSRPPVADDDGGASRAAAEARPTPLPRFTSDGVRKLFRDVAKAIHPDLASDTFTRNLRHSLMVEANLAYASRDAEQLRLILQAWESSPEAVPGNDREAIRVRLIRRMAQIEEHLQVLTSDLADLKDTPLWKLKAMVDEAAAAGKDLVRDMIGRLKRDILTATNRLDAMRPPSQAAETRRLN
jgi:uncharacterized coiled-coil protein SlyX